MALSVLTQQAKKKADVMKSPLGLHDVGLLVYRASRIYPGLRCIKFSELVASREFTQTPPPDTEYTPGCD